VKTFILRNIPDDLHLRLKLNATLRAAQEDKRVSMGDIILEAIREKLDREEQRQENS